MIPFSEIQNLNPDAIIELFEVDATSESLGILRFHAGTNNLNQDIVWQSNLYIKFPVEVSGFDLTASGPLPRPTLKISNFMSSITALIMSTGDMLGLKVTRKRTMKKYLDAVNFAGGVNPTADVSVSFPDEIYFIERKISEAKASVEFELVSSMDLNNQMFPKRQIIQNSCSWKYRGSECGYVGTNYFDKDDNPTNLQGDYCAKKISSCKKRFGETSELPYGGFPGADLFKG